MSNPETDTDATLDNVLSDDESVDGSDTARDTLTQVSDDELLGTVDEDSSSGDEGYKSLQQSVIRREVLRFAPRTSKAAIEFIALTTRKVMDSWVATALSFALADKRSLISEQDVNDAMADDSNPLVPRMCAGGAHSAASASVASNKWLRSIGKVARAEAAQARVDRREDRLRVKNTAAKNRALVDRRRGPAPSAKSKKSPVGLVSKKVTPVSEDANMNTSDGE